MTEFEFLSVMISIIFGLGLTHILAGSLSSIFANRATEAQLVYSAFGLLVLVLNWWVIFIWRDHSNWSFDEFLVLVLWAISHYLIAITLYPPEETAPTTFEHSSELVLVVVLRHEFPGHCSNSDASRSVQSVVLPDIRAPLLRDFASSCLYQVARNR